MPPFYNPKLKKRWYSPLYQTGAWGSFIHPAGEEKWNFGRIFLAKNSSCNPCTYLLISFCILISISAQLFAPKFILIKQNLLHRHKFIPLFLQFIHDFQCRGHRRGIVIMHQYYIVLLCLIHHFIYHTARIFRTPVQRINICNRSKDFLLLFFKKLLMCC